MSHPIRVAIVIASLATPALAADPPSIDKLIEQLGSRSFAEREKASKLLSERGPAALPALRKAKESKDEEIRKRAEALIPPMEIEEALLPKRVTFKIDDGPVEEVLKEIAKQTGYSLSPTKGTGRPKIKLEVREAPFWEAIEKIAKETGRDVQSWSFDKVSVLQPGKGRSPYINIRGPFRLEAGWFHEDRDIDFAEAKPGTDGKRDRRLTLSVSLLAEPRLTFLKIGPAKVDEALDADGTSLLEPSESDAGNAIRSQGRGTYRGESLLWSDIRLKRASDTAKSAKLIRGVIPVKTILIRRPVVVTSKLLESTGTTFRAGNESLQITRVQNQGGGSVEVQILIPHDRNADWSQHDQWYQRFHVEDDSGNKFQDHGRGSQSDGRQYWISLYYGPPNGKAVGPPTKLVFEDWVVHEHAIPFEFKDVPLP